MKTNKQGDMPPFSLIMFSIIDLHSNVRRVPFAASYLGFSGVRFGAPRNALDGVSGQLQAIFLSVQPVPMRLLLLFPDI